jgi:hypothetical protein
MGRVTVQWRGPNWLRRTIATLGLEKFHMRATNLALTGPNYDDRAVAHLVGLRRLESLTLSNTKLSAAAIADLRAALPKCEIVRY